LTSTFATGYRHRSGEAQKILQSFDRWEGSDRLDARRYGGTDLADDLVAPGRYDGGKITVESQVGSRQHVSLRCPLRGSLLAPCGAPAQPPVVDLHWLRVLIVTDNATNRTIPSRLGKRLGK